MGEDESQETGCPDVPLSRNNSKKGTRKGSCNPVVKYWNLRIPGWEFLLWLSGLRTQHDVCEDAGFVPGHSVG